MTSKTYYPLDGWLQEVSLDAVELNAFLSVSGAPSTSDCSNVKSSPEC